MYSKQIPFKDFNGKARNQTVHFNLTEREVFKLLGELQAIFKWRESLKGDKRELSTEEVVEFYNQFEEVLLSAYGEPSEDGLHFRKSGRYDFEESALFSACMLEFVTNPAETGKLLEAILPKDMDDIVKKADANLVEAAKNSTDEDLKGEVARLRAMIEEKKTD